MNYYCKNCGFVGQRRRYAPGSLLLELSLFCFTVAVGWIIYRCLRSSKVYYGCPKCAAPNMIPADSPVAKELGIAQTPTLYEAQPRDARYTTIAAVGAAVILVIIVTMSIINRNNRKLESGGAEQHGSSRPIDGSDAWLLHESVNQIDNTPMVSLTKPGANGTALVIRCANHETDAFVATDTVVDSGSVRIRFDGSAPLRQRWTESTDHTALFVPDAVTFARQLAGANSFMIEYTPFEKSPRTLTFDVANLQSNLQKISETCDWESVDRKRARTRAANAALRARVLQYVHSCQDQQIGKWCWSDPDNDLFSNENGFAETREAALENALEYARMGLAFKGK